MRVVVLGAGFGGLELTTRLSDELGDDVDVTLIDRRDGFTFGFSKLDVMFGHMPEHAVLHPYGDFVKPGVRFVQTTITSIDPVEKRVETEAGVFDADVLVVALGADLHPEGTPGLLDAGHEFYTEAGAYACRSVLEAFDGGRVIVAVTSTPFKCPPAPSETALLLHDYLIERRIRERSEIALVMPMPVPIPPSPEASRALLGAFEERGISWHPSTIVQRLDPERRVAMLASGDEMPFDLFLGVPQHQVPTAVAESGLAEDGWIAVDPRTLETRFPDVFAVGDVTSVGTPKAGVFSEGQAVTVAETLIRRARGDEDKAQYGGTGLCYLEFGRGQIAKVGATFLPGQPPVGEFVEPSESFMAEKREFGTSRIQRWFGRTWP